MGLMDTLIDMLPEINSIQALLLYSMLAYIFTMLIRWCTVTTLEDQIDVAARVKQNILLQRKKRD